MSAISTRSLEHHEILSAISSEQHDLQKLETRPVGLHESCENQPLKTRSIRERSAKKIHNYWSNAIIVKRINELGDEFGIEIYLVSEAH